MNFYILHEDGMKLHEQFMANEDYKKVADAIKDQGWIVNENDFEPDEDADRAIMLGWHLGKDAPVDQSTGKPMWVEKYGWNAPSFLAPAGTPDFMISNNGKYHSSIIYGIMLYMYPHALLGVKGDLFYNRIGRGLRFLFLDPLQGDVLVPLWNNPSTDRQHLLRQYFQDFPALLANAVAEGRRRGLRRVLEPALGEIAESQEAWGGDTDNGRRVSEGRISFLWLDLEEALGVLSDGETQYVKECLQRVFSEEAGDEAEDEAEEAQSAAGGDRKAQSAAGRDRKRQRRKLVDLFPNLRL